MSYNIRIESIGELFLRKKAQITNQEDLVPPGDNSDERKPPPTFLRITIRPSRSPTLMDEKLMGEEGAVGVVMEDEEAGV